MIRTSDGRYLGAGQSVSAGDRDGWLVKTTSDGAPEWMQTYGGPNHRLSSVIESSDGGYVAAGTTRSRFAEPGKGWLLKTDEDGTVRWEYTHDYSRRLQDLVQTGDGGYITVGTSTERGSTDGYLMKRRADGAFQGENRYGGAGDDWLTMVTETADGGYLLTGVTTSPTEDGAVITPRTTTSDDNSPKGWLVKTGDDGGTRWQRAYTSPESARGYLSAGIETSGGYLAVGRTDDSETETSDAWVLRTDSQGAQLGATPVGGPGRDVFWGVTTTGRGGYLAGGQTYSQSSGELDGWFVPVGEDMATTEDG